MHQQSRSPNRFLQSISPGDFELLAPHLRSVELRHSAVLFEPGGAIDRIYFPLNPRHFAGRAAWRRRDSRSWNGRPRRHRGHARRSRQRNRRQPGGGAGRRPGLRGRGSGDPIGRPAKRVPATALYQYDQLLLIQAQQSAACNATHRVEERLCRWLLRSRDVLESDLLPSPRNSWRRCSACGAPASPWWPAA